nr:M24 family metallopeptidase [Candidatus Gracilibacteria bacterium]
HYINSEKLPKMQEGMIFTIEPMVNLSPRYQTVLDPKDHWTVRTKDSAVSAQFEHTVLVTKDGVEVLTQI